MYLLGLLKILPFVAINIADFVPRRLAHRAVGRKSELTLKALDGGFGGFVKMPGHGGLAEGRVILGNAGKLPLNHPYRRAGAAAF